MEKPKNAKTTNISTLEPVNKGIKQKVRKHDKSSPEQTKKQTLTRKHTTIKDGKEIKRTKDKKEKKSKGRSKEPKEVNKKKSTKGKETKSKVEIEPEKIRSCTYDCIFDGRLVELSNYECECFDRENNILIGHGSFGKVYKSDLASKRFGIHVVVKKVPLKKENERSIKREMISSRVLHPFILPLLAVVNEPIGTQEAWFVSPLCSKGDLNALLERSYWREGELINAKNRIKIIVQLALAIRYIHTPVRGIREVILHKDISSKNVLLDGNYNARLIDFGSAREIDVKTTRAGGCQYYCHPDIGKEEFAKESWDYHSFGVIMIELLTSLGPEGKSKWLKYMNKIEVNGEIDRDIWTDSLQDKVDVMNEIASSLINQKDWKVSDFTENVIEKLEEIVYLRMRK